MENTLSELTEKLREIAFSKTLTTAENEDIYNAWNNLVKPAEMAGISHQEMNAIWNQYNFMQ